MTAVGTPPRGGHAVARVRTLVAAALAAAALGSCAEPAICGDARPCPLGTRQWVEGGACLPSEPCAGDTACAALGRVCEDVVGVARCGRCLDDRVEAGAACVAPEPTAAPRFRVGRDHFAVFDGERHRHLFVRGINVGGPRPGETADDSSLTEADWTRWLGVWADAGLNTLRVYRLHPPPLYRALDAWNGAHPERPIYLMQGVYLDESGLVERPDLFPRAEAFDALVREAIDCVHGQCPGYPDVSGWTLAWLPGREVLADEVLATDAAHPGVTAHDGAALSIADASASEVWVVARLDAAVRHERDAHGEERPIGFSNWLELDPLEHPTEPDATRTDVAAIDLARVDASQAPAGHFVAYHAYPYYPVFLKQDPVYATHADAFGPNPYRGILRALRRHHRDQALLIAEFGLPTTFAPAHTNPAGMDQGGLDERAQGRLAARMLDDLRETGTAGGLWFKWEDGWWKRAWTSRPRTFPDERVPLWHDLLDPEQGFGWLAFEPVRGDFVDVPLAGGSGAARSVRARAAADLLEIRVELERPLGADELLEVGLDVLDRTRGEPRLPTGAPLATSRPELAVVMRGPRRAELLVTPCLDLTDLPRGLLARRSPRTRAGGCGGWATVQWLMFSRHERPDGCVVPDEIHPIGTLRVRDGGETEARPLDAVVVDGAIVTVSLPWSLALFADPSSRLVLDDRPETHGMDGTPTDGVVIAVARGGAVVETSTFTWPTWDQAPAWEERLKAGASTFFDATRRLPRYLD